MVKDLTIGEVTFHWGERTYLMGILNVTPDSFSGDGLVGEGLEAIVAQAREFVNAGVDILDVGGESTRPGADPVPLEEELDRVIPVIERLSEEFGTLISIDTYKAKVAEQALAKGADLVNDVWGLRADPELRHVVAEHGVPVILMHNRSDPSNAEVKKQLGGRYVGIEYDDLLEDVKRELMESVEIALDAGIPRGSILIDPGIGFGKTVEQNLELLNRVDELRALGYPVLVGPSRKSFIGYTLDLPPEDRLEGTAATVSVAITRGADVVRVHDVVEMARVVKMTDAIVRT